MLKLNRLSIRDFLSHEESEFNFSDPCRILIDGISGSGKTAIVEAIVWALFGNARVENRSLIRNGKERATVVLELLRGEETIQIERSVVSSGKQTLNVELSGVDESPKPLEVSGLRNIQEWIEKDLLHASYALFVNSIAYPQNNAEAFIYQTASKRKELLLEIIGAGDFDVLYTRAKEKLQLAEEALARIQSKIEEKEHLVGRKEEFEKKISESEKALLRANEKVEALREIIEKSKEVKLFIKGLVNDVTSINRELQTMESMRGRLQGQKKALESSLKRYTDQQYIDRITRGHEEFVRLQKRFDVLEGRYQELNAWNAKRDTLLHEHQLAMSKFPSSLEDEIADYNQRLSKLEEDSDYECPECGTPIPRLEQAVVSQRTFFESAIHERNEQVKKRDEELKRLDQELIQLGGPPEDARDEHAQVYARLQELQEVESEWKRDQNFKEDVEDITKQLKEIQGELDSFDLDFRRKIDELQEKKDAIKTETEKDKWLDGEGAEKRLEESEREKSSLQYVIGADRKMLELSEIAERDIGALKIERSEKLNQKEPLEAAKEAFGSKGLKVMIIDYVAPKLEKEINDILSRLSEFRIEIETQRPTADGNSVIEGLFISIVDASGNKMEFNSYSGGERLKIVVAISEALASLQKIDFRIVDELFIGLDADSTERFAEVLTAIQDRFSQFLVISHVQSIKDIFDDCLHVTKRDGVSSVSVIK